MTKNDLITVISEKAGIKNKDAKAMVDTVIGTIYSALSEGDNVSISGFGTFEIRTRAARKGISPATKQPIDIPESKTVAFKATKSLREKLN